MVSEHYNSNTANTPAKPPENIQEKNTFKHKWLSGFGILGVSIFLIFLCLSLSGLFYKSFGINNYWHNIIDFVFTPQAKIKTFEGRTNLLILGKGGLGHTAPDLTDTIIFASVSLNKPAVVLVSIPRDIWVPAIRAKINSAYYWGNQENKGGGISLAKSLVEEIVGQPIHYGLVIDFSGFTKIIDVLGGIQVEVERSFIDEKYPIAGKENDLCGGDREYKCRYETIKFEKGIQFMNGELALKFVRSRYAQGDEGTDLARDARQQKVIQAIKKKILSPQFFLSPKRLLSAWKVVQESIETEWDDSSVAILARKLFNARNNIKTYVLSEELLIHPPVSAKYDNQYVFIPKKEGWVEVKRWVGDLLKN